MQYLVLHSSGHSDNVYTPLLKEQQHTMSFKLHGKYCGPGYSDGRFGAYEGKVKAIDANDSACKEHDLAYTKLKNYEEEVLADKRLADKAYPNGLMGKIIWLGMHLKNTFGVSFGNHSQNILLDMPKKQMKKAVRKITKIVKSKKPLLKKKRQLEAFEAAYMNKPGPRKTMPVHQSRVDKMLHAELERSKSYMKKIQKPLRLNKTPTSTVGGTTTTGISVSAYSLRRPIITGNTVRATMLLYDAPVEADEPNQIIRSLKMNPYLFGQYFFQHADFHTLFRVKSVHVHWVPDMSMTTTGTLTLFYVSSIASADEFVEDGYFDPQQVANLGNKIWTANQPIVWRVPVKADNRQGLKGPVGGWYYCDPNHKDSAQEPEFSYQGQLFFGSPDTSSGSIVGKLFAEVEVEFKKQEYTPSQVVASFTGTDIVHTGDIFESSDLFNYDVANDFPIEEFIVWGGDTVNFHNSGVLFKRIRARVFIDSITPGANPQVDFANSVTVNEVNGANSCYHEALINVGVREISITVTTTANYTAYVELSLYETDGVYTYDPESLMRHVTRKHMIARPIKSSKTDKSEVDSDTEPEQAVEKAKPEVNFSSKASDPARKAIVSFMLNENATLAEAYAMYKYNLTLDQANALVTGDPETTTEARKWFSNLN